jgi:hypothetical protein
MRFTVSAALGYLNRPSFLPYTEPLRRSVISAIILE